jgi:NADPH:quinone reductase-like Zn-dependent oxidoreductase
MRAVVLTGHGGLDKLVFERDWPEPVPVEGEVLVEVSACAVNNTDINGRIGWYAKDDSDGGGWRSAIEFPRIQGADVCGYRDGRRVLVDPYLRDWSAPLDLDRIRFVGSEHDGGFAELVAVPARNVYAVDSDLSDAELASFITSSLTALLMVERAGVTAGDTVLVTGASGGVGTALVQLVRSRGATPLGVCGPDKADGVRALGAERVFGRDDTPDVEVDVVADVVAGPRWPELFATLRRAGRYVASGAIAGPIVPLDLRTLYLRDLTMFGATVPPPGLFAELVRMIERGDLKPVVARVFPLEELRAAQEAFLEKGYVGKFVIDVRAR